MLSRFIINLRHIDRSSDDSLDNHNPSQSLTLHFYVPTLDQMMDNLGEPLDFVEYTVDDSAEEQEDELYDSQDNRTIELEDRAGQLCTTFEAENQPDITGSSTTVDVEHITNDVQDKVRPI